MLALHSGMIGSAIPGKSCFVDKLEWGILRQLDRRQHHFILDVQVALKYCPC
jgi:hypothetical protein